MLLSSIWYKLQKPFAGGPRLECGFASHHFGCIWLFTITDFVGKMELRRCAKVLSSCYKFIAQVNAVVILADYTLVLWLKDP